MKKFKIEKLVRDNCISMMEKKGTIVCYECLNDEAYINCLKQKLIEEANEVSEETEREKLIEELADVIEVTETLLKTLNISEKEVQEFKKKKLMKEGGFEKKAYVKNIKLDKNNIDYQRVLKKYPEIKED